MECKRGMHKIPCEASIHAYLHEYRQKVYLGVGAPLHVKCICKKEGEEEGGLLALNYS